MEEDEKMIKEFQDIVQDAIDTEKTEIEIEELSGNMGMYSELEKECLSSRDIEFGKCPKIAEEMLGAGNLSGIHRIAMLLNASLREGDSVLREVCCELDRMESRWNDVLVLFFYRTIVETWNILEEIEADPPRGMSETVMGYDSLKQCVAIMKKARETVDKKLESREIGIAFKKGNPVFVSREKGNSERISEKFFRNTFSKTDENGYPRLFSNLDMEREARVEDKIFG